MKKTIPNILVMLFLFHSLAYCDEDVGKTEKWEFEVTPYLWLPKIDARSTVNGQTQPLDLTFKDIFDNFDLFGISGRFEAWKGKWGLLFDGMYVDLDGDFSPPPQILDKVKADITQGNLDIALSYRLCKLPLRKECTLPLLSFDLYGGGRYVYLKQKIRLKNARNNTVNLGKSKDWAEPFVGGCIILKWHEKVACYIRADIGGFGIGSASTKTWNFLGGFGYLLSEKYTLKVGYRIYDIDYSNGSGADEFGLDGKLQGPQIGLTYHF